MFAQDAVYPYGAGGPNGSFAFLTAYYMRTYGAKPRISASCASPSVRNALRNPNALFKKPLTLEEYLGARLVADPLRLFDCVMPCAGADAFLVMSEERARRLGLPHARLTGAIERHNAFPDRSRQHRGGWAMDRDQLYAAAGIGPADIDVIEVYDDYPVVCVFQIEDLGFLRQGRRAGVHPPPQFRGKRQFSFQHLGRTIVGRPGRSRRWHARAGRGDPASHGTGDRRAGRERAPCAGLGLRHDQFRPRTMLRRRYPRRNLIGIL
jgi:Acetyl-CoA acetyltransferase